MKKHILLIGFLFFSLAGISQTTVYGVFQGGDMAFGARIEQQFSNIGIYGSATKGDYRFYGDQYVKDHVALSVGGVGYFNINNAPKEKAIISLGITHHKYGEKIFFDGYVKDKAFNPWSFCFGGGLRMGHLNTIIVLDALKFDVLVGVGITFGFNEGL